MLKRPTSDVSHCTSFRCDVFNLTCRLLETEREREERKNFRNCELIVIDEILGDYRFGLFPFLIIYIFVIIYIHILFSFFTLIVSFLFVYNDTFGFISSC